MPRIRPDPGSVVEIPLPDGSHAYGRVYRDATVCFYREASRAPGEPPIGSRTFLFCCGVYDNALASWNVCGIDPFDDNEDEGWPPPTSVKDPITGGVRVYPRGSIRDPGADKTVDLEPAAVWNEAQLVARLVDALASD